MWTGGGGSFTFYDTDLTDCLHFLYSNDKYDKEVSHFF